MNIAKLSLVPLLFVVVSGAFACSSSSSSPEGVTGDGEGSNTPELNPYGVAYPTENIGIEARKGTRPGNVIQNYKFRGYPDANVAGGLQQISLANFFDPEGKKYKLIHVAASASWCNPCRNETQMVAPLASEFEEKGVVWLISLIEGPSHLASTQKDLDTWISELKAPYTQWLDPGNQNLGPFYDVAAIPWNCNINAQTMEILTAENGAPPNVDALWGQLNPLLDKINSGELK